MPPKKRGRPTTSTSSTSNRPTKRVRVGETSIIGTQDATQVTESGRPRRNPASEPNYNDAKRTRAPTAKQAVNQAEKSSTKVPTNQPNVTRKRKPASKLFGKRRASTTLKSESDTARAAAPRRGRPPKGTKTVATEALEDCPAASKKGRGRPPKTAAWLQKEVKESKAVKAPAVTKETGKAPVKRAKTNKADPVPKGTADLVEDDEDADDSPSGRQYWLMKAEPESRIEKGIDVRFSIDDLKAKGGPEAWDGVRNAAARNHMRAMRVGDRAFFYHSNCKIPGIVGIMEVVAEHTIDESAFDPKHPYYDEKSSRDKPKWDVVHVQFVRKFPDMITLTELRSFAKSGGVLENMQMVKQSRLSVSPVKPKEWEFILSLVDENVEDGSGESETEDTLHEGGEIVDGEADSERLVAAEAEEDGEGGGEEDDEEDDEGDDEEDDGEEGVGDDEGEGAEEGEDGGINRTETT